LAIAKPPPQAPPQAPPQPPPPSVIIELEMLLAAALGSKPKPAAIVAAAALRKRLADAGSAQLLADIGAALANDKLPQRLWTTAMYPCIEGFRAALSAARHAHDDLQTEQVQHDFAAFLLDATVMYTDLLAGICDRYHMADTAPECWVGSPRLPGRRAQAAAIVCFYLHVALGDLARYALDLPSPPALLADPATICTGHYAVCVLCLLFL
jgi:hypothetical protein